MPLHGSEGLADRLRPFAPCFTAAVWRHVLVLVAGTLLAPGRRTVAAALRVTGLERSTGFAVPPQRRPLVGPGRGPPPAPRARRRPRPRRPGGGRHRRHRRAPLGRQDRGARHLPRSRALQPRALRQGERPALAVPDGDGADALGRRLGPAVPHRARPFRASCPRPRATPQEADGGFYREV